MATVIREGGMPGFMAKMKGGVAKAVKGEKGMKGGLKKGKGKSC